MSQSRHKAQSWTVRRQFEPDRLSPERLADAYEKVVTEYVRVIETTTENTKTQDQAERQRAKEA